MKLSPAPLALLAVLAASASFAQEFAGLDDISGRLAGFNGAARQLQQIPQAPVYRAMGSDRGGVTSESLDPSLGPVGTPDVTSYLVRGIDISHYQHTVDWSVVKTAGLSFVYVKATEGEDGVDETFAANWAGAKSAGLRRGAYHFYNFCKSGTAQAAQFAKTVPPDGDSLPPTVDLEQSGDCKTMPAKAKFRKSFANFVAGVQAAYGKTPVIYVNAVIYAKYFEGEGDSYRIWIADIRHTAPVVSGWTMWQYGWHGTVPGITGEVDLDVFNGTPQMLAALNDTDNSVLVASTGPQ